MSDYLTLCSVNFFVCNGAVSSAIYYNKKNFLDGSSVRDYFTLCLVIFLFVHGTVSSAISGLEPKCPPLLLLSEKLAKSLQPTLESSSIQTAEPIVKCYTIL